MKGKKDDLKMLGIGTCPNCHTLIDNHALQIKAILNAKEEVKKEMLKVFKETMNNWKKRKMEQIKNILT